MTAPHVREEWVGEKRVLAADDAMPPTMQNFAWSETRNVMATEPRLAALAELVVLAARSRRMTERVWAGVDAIAATLVGPGRSVTQVTPVSAVSVSVAGTLTGAVTRQRFLEALRASCEVAA